MSSLKNSFSFVCLYLLSELFVATWKFLSVLLNAAFCYRNSPLAFSNADPPPELNLICEFMNGLTTRLLKPLLAVRLANPASPPLELNVEFIISDKCCCAELNVV